MSTAPRARSPRSAPPPTSSTAFAKRRGIAVILVGHVTKDGQIAGPRVVEHMVDTVLYFEGERGHQFRILRAVKNRFGPADEIGVFEMTGAGLAEVANPSALFLSERDSSASGSAVFAGIEGTRPLLVEIQALVARSALGTARRTVVGWDAGRLAMVLAVLEARCGIGFGRPRTSISTSPAACASPSPPPTSRSPPRWSPPARTSPLPRDAVVFGEISLSGALRPIAQAEARLREAAKLGFTAAYAPAGLRAAGANGLAIHPVADLAAFMDKCFGTIDR